MRDLRRTVQLLLSLVLLVLGACSRRSTGGVAVESLAPQGAAARAGLRVGDVLLSWRRPAAPPANPKEATGALRSCTDVAELEIEQAPRAPLELRVQRRDKVSTVKMPAGDWQLEASPRAAARPEIAGCAAYARARRAARESHQDSGDQTETKARREQALQAFAETAGWARAAGRIRFAALVLQQRAVVHLGQAGFAAAAADLQESLRLLRTAAPGSLEEAAARHLLGREALLRGDFKPAEAHLFQALELRAHLAPDSLERASTLNNLGIAALWQGDLGRAKPLYLQALGLVRRRAPGSLEEGQLLNNLGLLARASGDPSMEEACFVQANRILQRVDPNGEDLARNRTNLAALASDRGDFALAEEYDQAALRHFEATAPQSLETAKLLANLGIIARERFNYQDAEALFRRALAIQRRQAPGSPEEAIGLSNLAWVLQEEGRLGEAEDCARQALAIRSRVTPGSPDVALSLSMLGAIAAKREDYRTAVSLGEQALELQRRVAPGTEQEADILQYLGDLDLQRNRLQEAERYTRQALAIRRRLFPQSRIEARSLNLLGEVLWRQGRTAEAGPTLAAAVDALEAQIGTLGGTEDAEADFQNGLAGVYQDLINFEIEQGKGAAALQSLERWRARGLLAQIAQRDLAFSADIPAPLLKRQRELEEGFRNAQMEIAEADPRHEAELEAKLVILSRLRNERSALEESIVRASPRYASLRHPRPLDLAAARNALDPGTVWLSYLVGKGETVLFIVTPAGTGEAEDLRVFHLPAGEKALAEEVAVFRSLILRGREAMPAEPALLVQGRKLYDLLIAPAAPWIGKAERILISPDGPLHVLPFSALVRPGKPAQWLLEWKPVHTVLSATLYAQLKAGRRPQAGGGPLVAFADPATNPPSPGAVEPSASPLRRYHAGLPPLPGAREEVGALAALYGRDARVYTGADATKARLESLPVRARYLHFACHALLDRRFPLDSSLALARSGVNGDDGMLQAWEIFERLRLDADLVTLSACDSGLGREEGGEGLIGLTRAFQYAGARTVLAALWSVADRSSADLMPRFYAKLRSGLSKDVALAEAQREMLHGGAFSHPYSWAAFELNGDWR
ncbi:MAG TPA: CHAT domain-containing protein [Thermoanaerobaculia bacterium]|nr:CHAT domain-containing protein [Thermoanaerobaculia bacterium]